MNKRNILTPLRIICSGVLLVTGLVFSANPILSFMSLYFFAAAALTVGFDVLISAINGIIHGHMLDENFLMCIGSICSFALGEYAEGTFILLFYQIGEWFQAIAVGKSRKSIAELMDIRPDYANLVKGDKTVRVDPYDVAVGDIIAVEPGEKIPLDGIIIDGSSSIDTSSLTGESLPCDLHIGDTVISGSINLTSPLKIKASKEFDESTVSKILELAENASAKKAKAENFVTSFAKYYTPAVVIVAILTAIIPPLAFSLNWQTWILRAVMFIVISCPCALVVSVPLAFFGALGGASKSGILVKDSNYLEVLAKTDTVIFDKTGTLTKGSFTVSKICPANGIDQNRLLETAVVCEQHFSHPIAESVKRAYKNPIQGGEDYRLIAGKGVTCTQNGKTLLAGNSALLSDYGYTVPEVDAAATVIHVADGQYLGYILIKDEIKPTTAGAITSLKKLGIKQTVMLTGDKRDVAQEVADTVGIDRFECNLLPADKVSLTEKILKSKKGTVAYVGDGINDAPVLSVADVGIAMGALGSDAAIEAADIVIMNDDLSVLPTAVKIARKALRISKQNIAFSLIIKFAVMILAFFGIATIWAAVFADVGVLILAIVNSMRNLYVKK